MSFQNVPNTNPKIIAPLSQLASHGPALYGSVQSKNLGSQFINLCDMIDTLIHDGLQRSRWMPSLLHWLWKMAHTIDFLGHYYLNKLYEKQHAAYTNSVFVWLLSHCHFFCFHLPPPMKSFPTMWVLVLARCMTSLWGALASLSSFFSTVFYYNSTIVVHTSKFTGTLLQKEFERVMASWEVDDDKEGLLWSHLRRHIARQGIG